MTTLKSIIISLLLLIISISCKELKTPTLPGSGGKTCEIIVVCAAAKYNTDIKDSIDAFFKQSQIGLNQGEPLFSVVNIQPDNFDKSNMFKKHRNVIIVDINSGNEKNIFIESKNQWSTPQVVFKFSVKTKEHFFSLFNKHKYKMLEDIYETEFHRMQRVFKKSHQYEITDKMRNIFGFSFIFPEGFEIASLKRNLAWIRRESKDHGQGIIVHTYPYTSLRDFEIENIIKRRNEAVKNVPGPLDGSFMTTELDFNDLYPQAKTIDFNGNYAVETRGLWKLEGDFMGGPFINYVFADTNKQEIVMIDAYLYSPRKPKRDLLMQMEAIARSFEFYKKPKVEAENQDSSKETTNK